MTALQHICDGIEEFCGVDLTSSDQHLKISDSRVQQDNDECRKIVEWFMHYNPFPANSNLISISTGVVGDSRISCHMAKYPENETIGGTKWAERAKRTRKQMSSEVMFDKTMIPTVSKEQFLTNPKKRDRLISILMNKFSSLNMACKKADEDADCLIVNFSVALAPTHPSVVVIGEHIDLFVILIGIFTFDNIYSLKAGKGKIAEKIFPPHTALEKTIADYILFIHAMSGCDTTSALFNNGKMKFVQTLKNNPDLLKVIEIFKNPDITPEAVVDAENRFLVALYGFLISASNSPSLNNVR
ncbi:hypothetical protein AVEN_177752-1 [Araneus ventricosus]|uniref:Uncharacterized protein n=1 Tax=Araneus ventricosus TaxID=182803 RepID=A0A4Y2I7T7_ARAVE|nr:hypothetical protein AVEN_177752-1 [Araneus ventricosus]